MIQLNKAQPKIGDCVVIPRGLSWQVDGFDGEYTVSEIKKITWDSGIFLERNGLKIEIGFGIWSYLTGTSVQKAKEWTIIDPTKFQPEIDEEYGYDYHTEDNEEFGFAYLGWRGDHRTIDSTMVSCVWCYGKFPWYTEKEEGD